MPFPLVNRFNQVPEVEKPASIKQKQRKSWNMLFDKKLKLVDSSDFALSLILKVTLDDDFNFKGFFTCDRLGECLGRLTNEDRCYISGAMDFMVQTANSAIDGLYVGKLADEGYNEYKDQLPQESPLKTNEDRRNAICGRVNTTFGDSLLSIFEKNPPSKK